MLVGGRLLMADASLLFLPWFKIGHYSSVKSTLGFFSFQIFEDLYAMIYLHLRDYNIE